MHTRYAANKQSLIDAVLSSPGDASLVLRRAVAARSAQLGTRSTQYIEQVPIELERYIARVALYAYQTTDQDIEDLRNVGYSEDAIFEITLSAALGAGMVRLECGLAALKGGTDADQEA